MKKILIGLLAMAFITVSSVNATNVYADNQDSTYNENIVVNTETLDNSEAIGNTDNTNTPENTNTPGNTENIQNTEVTEVLPEPPYVPVEARSLKTTSTSTTKVKIAWKNEGKDGYKYKVYVLNNKKKYTYLGETKDNFYNATVEKNKEYTFKVVTYFNKKKLSDSGKTIKFVNKEFVAIDHQKYTYEEMVSDIKSLKKKYGEYMSYSSIGKSEQGREIYEVVIGNPNAKRCLLVTSTLHAREYIATVVCMKQIEYYLMNYNKTIDGVKPSKVFNDCQVRYIVMANPDGVTISQKQKGKATWKANAKGTDLNRNYPFNFEIKGDPKKGTYNGDEAGSAKETKSIMALSNKLKEKYGSNLLVLNYHAQGQVIFWDYFGEDTAVEAVINEMTKVAVDTTKYRKIETDGEPSNGNYREYVMYDLGLPSITVEVGLGGSPVKVKHYKSTFEKNKYLVLREAQILKKMQDLKQK